MPFKAARPLDLLSQGLGPFVQSKSLPPIAFARLCHQISCSIHSWSKQWFAGHLLKECECFHQVSGCCDGVSDSAPHQLWLSNHLWHLLYFFFLLHAILVYFVLLYNGEPLKTLVISWLSVSVPNIYPCFRLYFRLSCATANKLFSTVKWFILKDRKNRSLANSCSRNVLVGM